MIRTLILAAALFSGGAQIASAAQLIGTGDNAQLVLDAGEQRTVVGGGLAQLTGTGNNAQLSYNTFHGGQISTAGEVELAQVGLSGGKGA